MLFTHNQFPRNVYHFTEWKEWPVDGEKSWFEVMMCGLIAAKYFFFQPDETQSKGIVSFFLSFFLSFFFSFSSHLAGAQGFFSAFPEPSRVSIIFFFSLIRAQRELKRSDDN